MYYSNTLKRELVNTNAYKLQPSLSERVIVDGHGCRTDLNFGAKAKENKDKVSTLYRLNKLHKTPCERYMRDPVKTYFVLLNVKVKF